MVRKETFAIYFAGLIQGLAVITFPAISPIFTDPYEFNLSTTAYGSLFIPEALLSIVFSAINPLICGKFGFKAVFLGGLLLTMLSMILLAASPFAMHCPLLSYALLLFATGAVGIGYGLVAPTLNATAALLNPSRVDFMLLMLNALSGAGTAVGPLFSAFSISIGCWWGLPLLLAVCFGALFVFSLHLKLPGEKEDFKKKNYMANGISPRFWIFATFAFLYGIVETLNGNWLPIFMKKHMQASHDLQSLALAAFWGMATLGRVFFAVTKKAFRQEVIFQVFPFISMLAFITLALLPQGASYLAITVSGLAGFGCSVLLPLLISFGSERLKSLASSVPGMVITFYLLGYGMAAFGVGPLENFAQIDLREVYLYGSAIAFILGLVSFFVIKAPQENHSK
ncbi:MFS transporter [Parachlamydia sp. AcF125]|uniref:MFS transporter n=1 Tax=Parachlamydia sp. AcF125 TaxID=2795736 RepID=UPI001BD801EF|nr:MFS transporter [Parachlamydia sp. AcF125]MBS4168965.1 hypothetical protein [Parachlamydia sp. AcF125]